MSVLEGISDEAARQRERVDHRARDSIYNAGVDVVIAGLGLIGGSLGMALRRRGWHVSYVDPHVSLDAARAAGAADERRERLEADLIVLATAADVALALLTELRGTNAVVTSVSSVMKPLRDAGLPRELRGRPSLRRIGAAWPRFGKHNALRKTGLVRGPHP